MHLLPTFAGTPARNTVYNLDWLALVSALDDASVDAYILDLPYGTTACTWDEIIPFEPMWAQVKRTLKPRGVFVTTASQPFTSKLVMSNLDWFRYEWIWDKVQPNGFLNAKILPLKQHENVLVFSDTASSYYPQMTLRKELRIDPARAKTYGQTSSAYGVRYAVAGEYDSYYPKTILTYSNADQTDKQHPTQKPVALYEYLIRTYTQPGDLVVDFCAGSGTTAVAARNLKRDYIVGDTDAHYCNVARERLRQPYERHYITPDNDVSALPLFAMAANG